MYRRILVPLDGSKRAEKVLDIAAEEARFHSATLVLLRIVPPVRQGLMLVPVALDRIREQLTEIAQAYVAKVADRLRAEGVEVEEAVLRGKPAARVLEFAEENDCDLIIIGSHGQSEDSRWRFGSVANKVVKTRTIMPVLVVST
jgi:nucleotide-binding universal stress UspA family protein